MKICPKCSKNMSDSSSFCDACGTSLKVAEESIEILEMVTTAPVVETTIPPTTVPVTTTPPTTVPVMTSPPTTVPVMTSPPTEAPATTTPAPVAMQPQMIYQQSPVSQPQLMSQPVQQTIVQQPQVIQTAYSQQVYPQQTIDYPQPETKKSKKLRIVTFLIVIGIFITGLIGISALLSKVDNTTTTNEKTFYGEGYTITYGSEWSLANMANGNEALKYRTKKAYFVPIGQSKLEETITCDFSQSSCKTSTYDDFYTYWKEDIDSSMTLSKDSTFAKLKDGIYYATYNYSLNSTGELKGKYYLVISKEKNIVLSFLSNADESALGTLNQKIIELLNSIEIKEQVSSSEMGEFLENMSSWNQYSDLRSDAAGNKKTIYGEYRILSDSTSYWVFKSGEFWWYKDENNTDDNYWYGKMTVKTGKAGLKSVGIDESKLDDIIQQSDGRVGAGDIYALIMEPKKIISGGEDKSSTNIPKGTQWKFIWIIVDHGEEGIEAQVLNVDTSDTSYFVKIKD